MRLTCSLISLRNILIVENELTGPIPTEVGSLTKLEYILRLSKQLFSPFVTIMFWNKTDSHYVSKFVCLIFIHIIIDDNALTGTIPIEIGLLTNLTNLYLSKRLLSVLLSCFETKRIRSLILTISLFFFSHIILIASNELTGSIPTEIVFLPNLTQLQLSEQYISILLLYFETK